MAAERQRLGTRPRSIARPRLRDQRVSLCETLDRVLNKGAVVAGDIVISVAGVDLVYVGLNLVLASVETMRLWKAEQGGSGASPGLELPMSAGAGAEPRGPDALR